MARVQLDGRQLATKELLYPYIKRKFTLPDYFGNNLDALWDVLSTASKELEIHVIYSDDLLFELGAYGKAVLKLFLDLGENNSNITIEIKNNFKVFDCEGLQIYAKENCQQVWITCWQFFD